MTVQSVCVCGCGHVLGCGARWETEFDIVVDLTESHFGKRSGLDK